MQLDLDLQVIIDLYFATLRSPDPTVKVVSEPILPIIKSAISGDVRIPLTNGRYAVIDAANFDLVSSCASFGHHQRIELEGVDVLIGSGSPFNVLIVPCAGKSIRLYPV